MKKIKVGLLVGEFFSNSLPFANGKGGYGMLARNIIAEYVPNEEIEVDAIIGINNTDELIEHWVDDTKKVLFLPTEGTSLVKRAIRKFTGFKSRKIREIVDRYDIFLSIEFQSIARHVMEYASKKQKLILWIQDPRPESDWKELDTMSIKQGGVRPDKASAELLNDLYRHKRLIAVTQGKCLVPKARDLYRFPVDFSAAYLPNPVQIPEMTEEEIKQKKNNIVALARIDSVKRPWMIGEVARKLPQYEFFFLGQCHEKRIDDIMKPYYELKNCHFLGHVENEAKAKILSESKLLINTSIHEAVPVSFLEALSYGMRIVSSRNPDNITSDFGYYTGQVNGDGWDKIDLFVAGIQKLMEDENWLSESLKARAYIQSNHTIEGCRQKLREIILNATVEQGC